MKILSCILQILCAESLSILRKQFEDNALIKDSFCNFIVESHIYTRELTQMIKQNEESIYFTENYLMKLNEISKLVPNKLCLECKKVIENLKKEILILKETNRGCKQNTNEVHKIIKGLSSHIKT